MVVTCFFYSDHDATSLVAFDLHRLLLEGVLSSLGCEGRNQVCASLLLVVSGRVQPGMALELLDGVALGAVVAEQASNEVLEVSREAIAVHLLEVRVNLAGHEQVEEELLLASLLERENALNDNKEDDGY